MSACVVNGPEWAAMCRKAQHLAPGLCEHKCPFVAEGVDLASRDGDSRAGQGIQERVGGVSGPHHERRSA